MTTLPPVPALAFAGVIHWAHVPQRVGEIPTMKQKHGEARVNVPPSAAIPIEDENTILFTLATGGFDWVGATVALATSEKAAPVSPALRAADFAHADLGCMRGGQRVPFGDSGGVVQACCNGQGTDGEIPIALSPTISPLVGINRPASPNKNSLGCGVTPPRFTTYRTPSVAPTTRANDL